MFGRSIGQARHFRSFTRNFRVSATLCNHTSKDLEKLKQNLIRSNIRIQDSRSGPKPSIDDEKEANLRKIIATSSMAPKPPPVQRQVEELSINDRESIEKISKNLSGPGSENKSEDLDSIVEKTTKDNKDLQKLLNLPSNKEKERSKVSKQLEVYFDSIQDTLFTASQTLNDVTGYTGIEKLKKTIEKLEEELTIARDAVKCRKDAYSAAINERSQLQKDINELLTRKHEWSSNDLERFTTLYRNDHVNEQTEVAAQEALDEAEKMVDKVQLELTRLILTRYHEEQIWSDKIRKALTWGTWVLMGINIGLFMVATFFVEPWKRKKLVSAFEMKVRDMLDVHGQEREEIQDDKSIEGEISVESVEEVVQQLQEIKTKLEKVPIVEISRTEPTWDALKQNYLKVVSGSEYVQMRTFDVALAMVICGVLGTVIGYLVGN